MHSVFIYLFKSEFCMFDMDFGLVARDSGDPNETFHQLVSDRRLGPNKVDMFTYGSRWI